MFRAYLLAALTAWAGVAAAGASPKSVTAIRVTTPPVIDGILSDSIWRYTKPIRDFTQYDPQEGYAPTESTLVYLVYDDRALYVGVWCNDSNAKGIVGQLTRRDRTSEADRFTVMIDSYEDHQTGFVFSTNVSGVKTDGVLTQDGTVYDVTWDAVWQVAVARSKRGWSAEFAIPFNALRFATTPDGIYRWGVNFQRYISRKKETDSWVMVPRAERIQIAKWGQLKGLRNIKPPLHLEIQPYVSGTSIMESSGRLVGTPTTNKARAGADIKYGISRNFTFDATIHPDFGQVEVDEAVLNLTVFEPYFPEKRPFFLEGAQMFAFGSSIDNTSMPLFFSRRIGRTPSGSYALDGSGETVLENPQITNVLGAAKLTGRTSSGLTIATLGAATDRQTATISDSNGVRSTLETEPKAAYGVLRIRQDLNSTSFIGIMGTAAAHDGRMPGLSAGADWNYRFAQGAMTFDGYITGSRTSATADRDGTAGRLLLSRISAEHWLYILSADYASLHYDPNDLGYFARPHDRGGYAQLIYHEDFASSPFLRYSFSVIPEARWNWDGARTFSQVEASFGCDLTNFWQLGLAVRLQPPSYEDAERGIIGLRRRPFAQETELRVVSDTRALFSGSMAVTYGTDSRKKQSFSATVSLTLRPTSWAELVPFVYYQRTRRETAWLFPDGNIVDLAVSPKPFSVFGDRDVDQVDLACRAIVTFTRTLSLQGFAQVLIARGRYQNYARIGSSGDLVQFDFTGSPAYASHDFNETTLNANILLRWEFLPGSSFYLAWTQERAGYWALYEQSIGTSFRRTFALPQENVLLAKVTYWFSL
jgi:hypothetical protein